MTTPVIAVALRPAGGIPPETQFPVTVPVLWRLSDSPLHLPGPTALLRGAHAVITTVFTPEMGRAADSLKAILLPAAGYENINKDAVPEGCAVANAYEHEAPIAEWVLMAMVALDHEVLKADRTFRAGSWEMWPARHGVFRELQGQTLGVVGLGRIGMRVAQVARFLGMRCVAATRTIPAKLPSYMDKVVGIDRLRDVLGESDFVLVSIPLRAETRGLIGERELAAMKRTAYVINPARGAVIDEEALFEALRDGRIAGAALDTWWQYPQGQDDSPRPSRYPFWELENVLMTPHQSGATNGTSRRRGRIVAGNIDRLYRGEPLINIVKELSKAQVS
jgi:phosphoglycerate dehydrogenase-like enzyme